MKSRLKHLRDYLVKQQLTAAIITKPENRRYFSGFTGSSGVLLVSVNQAVLITDFRYTEQAEAQAPDFTVIRHGSKLFDTISELVNEWRVDTLGFESDCFTWDEYQSMIAMPGERDFKPMHLDALRMVKDEHEIALLKNAVSIADKAFSQILPYLKPGVMEREVALELDYIMRKLGSERSAFEIIVASGARSALPHGVASTKPLAIGDTITIDFGAVYAGYHSDITRTVFLGRANEQQRTLYNLVLEAQLAGVQGVKPGSRCADVDKIAREIIQRDGYGDFFGHGLGHGVGLAIHEEPRLSPSNPDLILEPNMVVTVEPGIYLPDIGGVRIEDTVRVTATNCEVLTASTKELIELDW
jgi:Xaa-Pro aminopeptidase